MTALLLGSDVFAKQYVIPCSRFNTYSRKQLGAWWLTGDE